MKFLQKNKISKTILVISDIHLGAGSFYKSKRNILEDFHYDKEMVDYLKYFSQKKNLKKEIELIINGDFFDLLSVPFVQYFDDEFWSEEASLEKLKIIMNAHPEILTELQSFLSTQNKKLTYIIGNHDGELIFPSLQREFLNFFPKPLQKKIQIIMSTEGEYIPAEGIVIKHGHQYELAHAFNPATTIITDNKGKKYFAPPWGSYYVTRIVNKFKEEREYINAVHPIKKFMIHGLIYDTLFTLRFLFANIYYFIMIRSIFFFKYKRHLVSLYEHILLELKLFIDGKTLAKNFFESRKEVKVLIVGHTHEPEISTDSDGLTFINTGTWTRSYHLDFDKQYTGGRLTYAQIDFKKTKIVSIALNRWKGQNDLPFEEFL